MGWVWFTSEAEALRRVMGSRSLKGFKSGDKVAPTLGLLSPALTSFDPAGALTGFGPALTSL
eukprot:3937980-Rhodomonas_salina.1